MVATTNHSFYNSMARGAKAAAVDFGVDVSVQGSAAFDPVAEAPILDAVINSKPDALIVVVSSPTALETQVKAADQAGIVVFGADNDVEDHSLRWTNIGTDHVASGKVAAQVMANAVGQKGTIAILASSPGPLVENLRIQGFQQGLATYTNIKLLPVQYCAGDAVKCASATSALISAHSDLTGVFGIGEPMGIGAGNGVAASGKKGVVKIGAFDAAPDQVQEMGSGDAQFLIVQRPYQEGYEAVRMVKEFLTGASVSASPLLPANTSLSNLPSQIYAKYAIAVSDTSICPSPAIADVPCGLLTDPAISQWLYTTG